MGTALIVVPEDPIKVEAMLELVTTGKSLMEIEATPEMPTKDVMIHWLLRNPALMQRFTQAREISSYTLEDEALSLLRSKAAAPPAKPADLKALEMLVQQLRWSAEKRNPSVYAQKGVVAVTVPIQINTSLDLAQGPGAGTKEHPDIYELQAVNETSDPDVIDAEVVSEAGVPAKKGVTAAQQLVGAARKREQAKMQKRRYRERLRAREAARQSEGLGDST